MPKGKPGAYKRYGDPSSGLKRSEARGGNRSATASARNKGQQGRAKRNEKASGRGRS